MPPISELRSTESPRHRPTSKCAAVRGEEMGSVETMRRFRHTILAWLSVAALVGAVSTPASVAADAFSTWTPGPGADGDNTYSGFIDVPPADATVPTVNFQVAGWYVDTTAQGWAGAEDVQFFQGTMDGGGKMLAKAFFA